MMQRSVCGASRAIVMIACVCACERTAMAQCSAPFLIASDVRVLSDPSTLLAVWDRDGDGPDEQMLVVAGRHATPQGNLRTIGLWDGVRWTYLTQTFVAIQSIAVIQNDLYLGVDTGMNGQAQLIQIEYTPLSGYISRTVARATGGTTTRINAITFRSGLLAFGGAFDSVDWVGAIVSFERNVAVQNNGLPVRAVDGPVNALVATGVGLFAGGEFSRAGEVRVNNVAHYGIVASSWLDVAGGLGGATSPGSPEFVRTVFQRANGQIVAAGRFSSSAAGVPMNSIAAWNGTSWERLGNGLPDVNALVEYDGRLLAAGLFNITGGPRAIAEYVQSAQLPGTGSWSRFSTSLQDALPIVSFVTSMTIYRDELILGGQFSNSGLVRIALSGSPFLIQQPVDVGPTLCASTLAVRVAPGYDAQPGLRYQWRRAGVIITDSPNGRISGANSAAISFSPLYASDAGVYTCQVISPCGNVESRPATIRRCIGDINCSGRATLQDVYDFVPDWFASRARADINGDGLWSFQDVLTFLESWFQGC